VTHPFARDLIGFWPMNEGNGTIINDVSGNKYDGDSGVSSVVPWGINTDGFTLACNGSNTRISLGVNGFLDGLSEFSITTKVSLNVIDTDQILFCRGLTAFADSGTIFLFFDDVEGVSGYTDVFRIILKDGGVVYSAYTASGFASINTEYIVTGVIKAGETLKIYVNGVDETAGTSGGALPAAFTFDAIANSETFGTTSDAARDLNGDLSWAAIHGRALLNNEIYTFHNEPYQIFDTGFNPAIFGGLTVASGRLSRYHNLNGLGGLGQQTFNPMG